MLKQRPVGVTQAEWPTENFASALNGGVRATRCAAPCCRARSSTRASPGARGPSARRGAWRPLGRHPGLADCAATVPRAAQAATARRRRSSVRGEREGRRATTGRTVPRQRARCLHRGRPPRAPTHRVRRPRARALARTHCLVHCCVECDGALGDGRTFRDAPDGRRSAALTSAGSLRGRRCRPRVRRCRSCHPAPVDGGA